MAATLITGATGFIGSHLAESLCARGEELVGWSRRSSWPEELTFLNESVALSPVDLADRESVRGAIADLAPERIYHLAGQAHVAKGEVQPELTWKSNVDTTRHLLEAAAELPQPPRVLLIGSGYVYGAPESGRITDASALHPRGAYAISKAASDLLALHYFQTHGLPTMVVRLFNNIGPRQQPSFAIASFAQQIARIEAGLEEPVLFTGSLSALRDFTDVRDSARAVAAMMASGEPGDVGIVAQGRSRPVSALLEGLLSLSTATIEVRQDPSRVRSHEEPHLAIEPELVARRTGWMPTIPLEQSLRDTLDYWRARVAATG
ncbi:GDP-6-deoxy-D-mannose reductase [Planctomycetes bacterium Pan216]|uniref:GDP-6-deoxy-D-mannose reductase n=1 Tax=Kolteria novifilia TaxID=2527975 RepID=A0A518B8Q1_9BACT|nr:GDP-6-deoxy-D-mannose reductase [Planctomycetes bacterium Pan216]